MALRCNAARSPSGSDDVVRGVRSGDRGAIAGGDGAGLTGRGIASLIAYGVVQFACQPVAQLDQVKASGFNVCLDRHLFVRRHARVTCLEQITYVVEQIIDLGGLGDPPIEWNVHVASFLLGC